MVGLRDEAELDAEDGSAAIDGCPKKVGTKAADDAAATDEDDAAAIGSEVSSDDWEGTGSAVVSGRLSVRGREGTKPVGRTEVAGTGGIVKVIGSEADEDVGGTAASSKMSF